jgi:hypothetical protein
VLVTEQIADARTDLADCRTNGDPVFERWVVRDHPFYWISVLMSGLPPNPHHLPPDLNYPALLCPERERKIYVGTLLLAMLHGG